MARIAVAATALAAGVAAHGVPSVEQEWADFKQKFGKTYKDSTEEQYRRGVFEANLQFIQKENAKEQSYKLGVNQFTDLLVQEWSNSFFGMKPPTATLYGDVPYLGRHEVGNASLPASIDWTTKDAVTPVKNQGQCGSCWSFSSTGAMEGAYSVANGKLVSLSEQQLVDCAQSFGEQGCNGGLMDGAFQYAQKNGMCTEESYSYAAKGGSCQATSCTKAFGPNTVSGFKDVNKDDKQALMSAVAQQPVAIAIEADQMVFQSYKSGVLSGMCGAKLDHGVLVVGYGTDAQGGDYWKVKNSWGPTWGMDGYVLLKRGKAGAGECGILSQASYPVISGSGPAPGPTPPTPPSPPPAPPAPSSSHYEKPPCQSDEMEAQIQGTNGEVCAPHCDTGACPSDVPEGTKARPQCALQDASSGSKYCALICLADTQCPTGASCAKVQAFIGVCVYAGGAKQEALPKLNFIGEAETITV